MLQLEYTVLGQYAGQFRHIPSILFEHDVYFQSIARRLPLHEDTVERMQARWEYLRSLRYELRMLPKLGSHSGVQRATTRIISIRSCRSYNGRIDADYRAGIDTSLYDFKPDGREPFTLLVSGQLPPFAESGGVELVRAQRVCHRPRRRSRASRLIVIGSEPPPRHSLPEADAIELIGFVEDVREPLARYAVFVCPILSGSGVRVKLLEAFAAGIPVVSTRLGAEGLATVDGEICALADDQNEFAQRVLKLIENPVEAAEMSRRARAYVVEKRDMRAMTERLVESYRQEVRRMRS